MVENDYLEQIRNAVPIIEVVSEKTKLTRKGREYTGLCPFHQEKSPSFYVNPLKGFYYCFGCRAKGNIFNFYKDIYRMSFKEAVEALAKKGNISLPESFHIGDFQEENKKNPYYDLCELTKSYFINNLNNKASSKAQSYLSNRGVSAAIIRQFEIGYASPNSTTLWAKLASHKFYEEDLLEIGLKNYNQEGKIYDFFRDRIIFPIKNNKGQTIAFGGRTLGNDNPKYLNTKESIIFHKKNTLYGLNYALQNLGKELNLIVVEGYMDVISLHQAGFNTAVAGMGTAITPEHINMINKYDKSPIFCLDGDQPGEKALLRILEHYLSILEIGLNPRFVFLEEKLDPDSYLKAKGKEQLLLKLKGAKGISEVIWEQETQGHNLALPEVSLMVFKNIYDKLGAIKNYQIKNTFLQYFKNKLSSPSKNVKLPLYNQGRGFIKDSGAISKRQEHKANLIVKSGAQRDAILLACIITFPSIYDEIEDKLGDCNFQNLELEKVRIYIVDNFSYLNKDQNIVQLIRDLFPKEYHNILNMNLVKPIVSNLKNHQEALKHFQSAYSLITKEYLQGEKMKISLQLQQLGKLMAELKDQFDDETYRIKKDAIENKINILLKQQAEIQKDINDIISSNFI